MSLNFLIFFSYYFIILVSILGYGCFLLSFEKNNKNIFNFGYVGLLGIFFLIVYSYLSNIFIPHTKTHNFILIIVGILIFVYFFWKHSNNPNFKKNFLLLIIVFFTLSISLLLEKNHDDFPYYHFSYTFNLTQESLNFGIGKLNHGFRTPSSIFYLNSLFFLPYADYYLFNFTSVFILGFANIILLKKILVLNENFKVNNNEILFINYLSLLSFIFINIFFYRISEYGTDRSAQILIFLLFVNLLNHFQNKDHAKVDLLFIYILTGLIISLKSFYFLYFSFFIPFFLFFFQSKKNIFLTFKFLFFNKYFVYLFSLIFLVVLSYFVNTGCLLYPISFTCFENFEWSIKSDAVSKMNDWYELWSKAGANPNFRVQNPEQYIVGFNWVSNWFGQYFLNKVSDLIFGLFLMILIIFAIFFNYKRKKDKIKISKIVLITYLFLILILFEWFYNHPALRYGGYCIISLILFIPYSFYLSRKVIETKRYNRIALILIIFSISVFEVRNYSRILNEIKIYNYKPISETFYSIDRRHLNMQEKINNLKNNDGIFSKTIF
jgi:hypothetical protein